MARTSTASSRTTKKSASASKSAGRKSSGAAGSASSAAKKASGSAKKASGSAKKAASGTAKKASSSAKKAASGTAKKATGAAKNATGTAKKAAGTAKRATDSATRAVKSTAKKATANAARATEAAASGTARKAAGSRSSAATKGRGSARSQRPDALQVLIDDHRRVEQMFKRFKKSGDGAERTRGEIAEQVLEELSVHAIIEEQAFYPAVRQIEKLEKMVLEALEEHHVVKMVLAELERMNPRDERFEAKFTVMMENVQHHVEEEEQDMFPKVRRAMSREQLESIGAALQEAKATAPTRPHPRSPDTPPGNLIAAAVTAPIDAAINAGKGAVDAVRNFADRNT